MITLFKIKPLSSSTRNMGIGLQPWEILARISNWLLHEAQGTACRGGRAVHMGVGGVGGRFSQEACKISNLGVCPQKP